MVFFGRFMPILRIWAGFLAGSLSMPWRRFLVFNATGAVVWAIVMGLGAHTFGHTAARVGGAVGLALAAVALFIMVVPMIGIQRGERRVQKVADRSIPSPNP